jgi:hypothetical protein
MQFVKITFAPNPLSLKILPEPVAPLEAEQLETPKRMVTPFYVFMMESIQLNTMEMPIGDPLTLNQSPQLEGAA